MRCKLRLEVVGGMACEALIGRCRFLCISVAEKAEKMHLNFCCARVPAGAGAGANDGYDSKIISDIVALL
jgi:hypothetical protein